MIQEALAYLVSLGERKHPVEKMEFGGRQYVRGSIAKVDEPLRAPIKVLTLTGLADLLGSDCLFEEFSVDKHLVHVVNHEKVEVITKQSNAWRQRETLVVAEPADIEGFKFGQFYNPEQFVIALQTCFVRDEDREKVLKVASNVTGEAVVNSADDGVSQAVSVKQSVVLKDTVTIRTVKLRPYRTFREVEQPVSEFVFRAKQEQPGQIPKLALFEADGGQWMIDATENIARYLRTLLPEKATVVS